MEKKQNFTGKDMKKRGVEGGHDFNKRGACWGQAIRETKKFGGDLNKHELNGNTPRFTGEGKYFLTRKPQGLKKK